jgi:uncharacterized membrane protein
MNERGIPDDGVGAGMDGLGYDEPAPEMDGAEGVAEGRAAKYVCAVTGAPARRRDVTRLGDLRPDMADWLRRDHPELGDHALICHDVLRQARAAMVEQILRDEHGEITDLEREVIESLARQETVSENVEQEFEEQRSFADRASDELASFGGSWRFIIAFFVLMILWMGLNVALGEHRAFDAYPFILLNLVLSCLAAIQAPIIMMSQKRQEQKDRLRSLNDYRVNLKAELEIRHLHEKMDHLVKRQWERLTAIQRIQIELLEELAGKRKGVK